MTAASSYAFQVSCSVGRPPISHRFDQFKASLASSVKPLLTGLQQVSTQIDVGKTIKDSSVKLVDAFVDLAFEFFDQPYLPSQSNFVPVEELGEAIKVTSIEGAIPDDFPEGVYLRNGSNPLFGALKATNSIFGKSSNMWVEGEGMIHAVYFDKNSAGKWDVFYNNKYVESETFKLEKERNKPGFLPAVEGDSAAVFAAYILNTMRFGLVNKTMSNTNIIELAGKFYAISENHLPQEIDIRTLETFGQWDVNGAWTLETFTSHPKKAPGTGELVTVGIGVQKPYLELGVISADGKKLVHKVDLKFERICVVHDIGVTERYNVILDHPLTLDMNRLINGGPILQYDGHEYARLGVMPRYGDAESIIWFEVDPCCVFHIMNSFEDDDEVVLRACRARAAIIPGPDYGLNKFEWFSKGLKPINSASEEDGMLFARVYEWRADMRTGKLKGRFLTGTEIAMDFPAINENFSGLKHKYGYTQFVDSAASSAAGRPKYGGLAKLYFDETDISHFSGDELQEECIKIEYHKFPKNTFGTGASFVPKVGGIDEDDGWVITYVHNEDTNVSQAYIVDAKKFKNEPVVKITLPWRVPYGFHGIYTPMNLAFGKEV